MRTVPSYALSLLTSLLLVTLFANPAGVAANTGISLASWPLTPQPVSEMPGTVNEAHSELESASGAQCRNYSFPVTERPDSKRVYNMSGQLCTKHPGKLGQQPLQVLIHGGTYNHSYFDWPYKPERYNYVRDMTDRGFTTLNIDRIGHGVSDNPNALNLNFDVAAHTVHQLVQYLRRGALGHPFNTIMLNGYSMGGMTAQVEAAKYNDVDAVAVHAVGHQLVTPRSTARLGTLLYPANLDPKFPKPLATGYTTTIPGTRGVFHGPPGTYDPTNLDQEEKLKDTLSLTELADITRKSYDPNITKNIRVPVLWTPGRYDKIWCGTTDDCTTDPETQNEGSYYRPGVFTKSVIPDTGHAALLGYGGRTYLDTVAGWLDQHGIRGKV